AQRFVSNRKPGHGMRKRLCDRVVFAPNPRHAKAGDYGHTSDKSVPRFAAPFAKAAALPARTQARELLPAAPFEKDRRALRRRDQPALGWCGATRRRDKTLPRFG